MKNDAMRRALGDINFSEQDKKWMHRALTLASKAAELNEVPVGALVVCDGTVLGEGFNQPLRTNDPTAHAEIIALRTAAARIGNYRLSRPRLSLYTTLEPCPMCAGAIVHARVARVVYGTVDKRAGSAGSVFNLLEAKQLNHRCEVLGGVCAADCARLLDGFFAERRWEEKRS